MRSSSTIKKSDTQEGAYYLEWREGAKRIRLPVGKNSADAGARRLRKEAELNALNNNGVTVTPEGQNGRTPLVTAVTEYLEEIKLSKKPKTFAAYNTALAYFIESCQKLYIEDIESIRWAEKRSSGHERMQPKLFSH